MKKIYHGLLIAAIGLSVCMIASRIGVLGNRIIASLRDFGTSLVFYFRFIFFADESFVPTVNELPEIDLIGLIGLDVMEIQRRLRAFGDGFFNRDVFAAYNIQLFLSLNNFSKIVLLLVPVFFILILLAGQMLYRSNNNYGENSRPLQFCLDHFTKPLRRIRAFWKGFWSFVKIHGIYTKLLLFLWLFNLNVFTILMEALAYYFYFAASVDIRSLAVQALKLLIDLFVLFSALPLIVWMSFGFVLFDKWRKARGLDVLRHYERRNRGFINSTPLSIMLVGTMGSKKTTTMTDMVLSVNAEFRDKALELMLKQEKRFVNFRWILLEKDLQARMEDRTIFNLASIRQYIRTLRSEFERHPVSANLFDYNLADNPVTYDDGLTVIGIWDTIEIYAQLYFIYVVESSYSLSNYSIRFDTMVSDLGNLPLYDNDFFDRPSTHARDGSSYAHILDFDVLRLGLKMIRDNVKSGSFEFGIVSITEIAKERGNQNDVREIRAVSPEANQKNDLFNDSLKLCRHAATVDNYPFIRFFDDDQRADSLNADNRELHDVINIASTSELRLAMPGFVFGDMLYDLIVPRFDVFWKKLRHLRGDSTLTGFLLQNLVAAYYRYYTRIYNRFGYMVSVLEIQSGKMDGSVFEQDYYLAVKKIYANRFATDCFADFFAEGAARSGMGINDYVCYRSSKASVEELKEQNSYFIRRLMQMTDNTDDITDEGE